MTARRNGVTTAPSRNNAVGYMPHVGYIPLAQRSGLDTEEEYKKQTFLVIVAKDVNKLNHEFT